MKFALHVTIISSGSEWQTWLDQCMNKTHKTTNILIVSVLKMSGL